MKPGTLILFLGRPGVVLSLKLNGAQALIQYADVGRVVTKIVDLKDLKERK